jgi:hypothetical protein
MYKLIVSRIYLNLFETSLSALLLSSFSDAVHMPHLSCLAPILLLISVSSSTSERMLSNTERISQSRRKQLNIKSLHLRDFVRYIG